MGKFLFALFLWVCSMSSLVAQGESWSGEGVFWEGDRCLWCRPPVRYHARPASVGKLVPATLANQQKETPYLGRGLYFEPGTVFAAFPYVTRSDARNQIMVLSDTGHWAFVKRSNLTFENESSRVTEIRGRIKNARRISSATNATDIFQSKVRACQGDVDLGIGGKFKVGAKSDLGIAEISVELEISVNAKQKFAKGHNVVIDRFVGESDRWVVEVQAYEECGTAEQSGEDYLFDVFVNGRAVKLRPADEESVSFPLDKGRPLIGCKEHYDAFVSYLHEQFELGENQTDWVRLIASSTARWSKYQSADKCERSPHSAQASEE